MKIHAYYFSWQKRTFDIVLAIILLLVLSPLLLVLIATNLLSVGWPIFFLQERAGKHKKPFWIIKFRTMQLNAHLQRKKYAKLNQAPAPMFKIYNDPRFVGFGKFLSQSGLDELPQLINILRGEMSFVGPRPLPVEESVALNKGWDFRYLVRPGIFSDWAIANNRNQSLEQWQKLEKDGLKKGGVVEEVGLMWAVMKKQVRV